MDVISGYYHEYVRRHRLSKNFRNHSVVTSLSRVAARSGTVDCESGEPEQELEPKLTHETLWEVCGYRTTHDERGKEKKEEFRYIAPNVVLATGVFDNPNRLGVPGESLPYVLHSYHDLERRLERHSTQYSDPVVVVGGGLSAADAILTLRDLGLQVVHVHRGGNPDGVYRQLAPTVYPEYHEINNLMHSEYAPEWYTGYSGYEVHGFTAERDVLIRCKTSGRETTIKAALVVVLIGSCPDLTFICPSVLKSLGVIANVPINGRRNMVDVDPFTYESIHHEGLYAMGPLVGDHMVRFLRGGALAITSRIWQKKREASNYIPLDTSPEDHELIENQWTSSLER